MLSLDCMGFDVRSTRKESKFVNQGCGEHSISIYKSGDPRPRASGRSCVATAINARRLTIQSLNQKGVNFVSSCLSKDPHGKDEPIEILLPHQDSFDSR